jgi:putative ABC transport system substrate-binding protein
VEQFRRGLRQLGYTEGPSLTIHYRFADGNVSRLQEQVTDLVRLKVDVIVACTSRAAVSAHRETQTIPIVMINVGDPVRLGLVASLARPAGNVTGTASYLPELAGKHLEILKELVPGMKHLAVLRLGCRSLNPSWCEPTK